MNLYIIGYPNSALYQYTGDPSLLQSTRSDFITSLGRRMKLSWPQSTLDESVALALYYALKDMCLKLCYIKGINRAKFGHLNHAIHVVCNSLLVTEHAGQEEYAGRLMAILHRSNYFLDRLDWTIEYKPEEEITACILSASPAYREGVTKKYTRNTQRWMRSTAQIYTNYMEDPEWSAPVEMLDAVKNFFEQEDQ